MSNHYIKVLYAVPEAVKSEAEARCAAIGQPNTFSRKLGDANEEPEPTTTTHWASYASSIDQENHDARVAAFAEAPDLGVLTVVGQTWPSSLNTLGLALIPEEED